MNATRDSLAPMNFTERLKNTFTPLGTAISDISLQIKARPLVFLVVWSLFSLVPQLFLASSFRQPINEIVFLFIEIRATVGPGNLADFANFQLTEQDTRVMMGGLRAMLVVLLSSLALFFFVFSVLGDIIAKFRKGQTPKIARSLREGLRLYVSRLKVILASAGRILAVPLAIVILGGVIGILGGVIGGIGGVIGGPFRQAVLIYIWISIIVSAVLLLINLLRYSLAPFAHLALGIPWRPALAASKNYYQSHRLAVLVLLVFVTVLPYTTFAPIATFLRSLEYFWFLNLGILARDLSIALVVLRGIVSFYMFGLLINFGMNSFSHHSGEIGEGDERREESFFAKA